MRQIVTVIIFLSWFGVNGQITFEISYSQFKPGSADLVFCQDDGYLIPVIFGTDSSQLTLIKTDLYGDTSWTRTYDFRLSHNSDLSGIEDVEGNIYLTFNTDNNNLVKLNRNGSIIWAKKYSTRLEELIIKDNILWGFSYRPLIYKIDAQTGDSLWRSDIMDLDPSSLFTVISSSLALTDNNDLVLSITRCDYNTMVLRSDIYKFAANSDSLEKNNLQITEEVMVFDIRNYGNEFISIAGDLQWFGNKIYFIRHSANGLVSAMNQLTFTEMYDCRPYKCILNNENNIIVMGRCIEQQEYPHSRIFLQCFSLDGDSLWTKIINRIDVKGYDIKLTNDNGFVISGERNSSPHLIKTTPLGSLNGIGEMSPNAITVYSDHASDNVVFNLPGFRSGFITIMNSTGAICAQIPVTASKVVWNSNILKPGLYLYSVINNSQVISGKLIK